MSGINAAVVARARVEDGRIFESMTLSILSALWEDRPPESVDIAGLGFTPAAIARHFDAAEREARARMVEKICLSRTRPFPAPGAA